MKSKNTIIDLFSNAKEAETYVKVCAPMVRYSKVQFRTLVRNFGVDLCFTPMILADSFCQNSKARASEFSTTSTDFPVIAQFAANNACDFVDASTLIFPYVDGVDLNCGCPQRWAIKDGYGCALLSDPETICNIVKGVKSNLPSTFSISVKIRLLNELKSTIQLCQQLEKCGVDFLTVHGRNQAQKGCGSVNTDALKDICNSISIPVIANGGIKTLSEADSFYNEVHCNGVMAAAGILNNPALFSGASETPLSCIQMWMSLQHENSNKITFQIYHHHLVFMLERILTKEQKKTFNHLKTVESVNNYLVCNVLNNLENNHETSRYLGEFVSCHFSEEITLKHSKKCRSCSKSMCYCICKKYDSNQSDGNYFTSFVKENVEFDFIDTLFN